MKGLLAAAFLGALLSLSTAIRYFPANAIYYQDVSQSPLDPMSSQTINWVQSNGGWSGPNGDAFQVDVSFHILYVNNTVATKPVKRRAGYYRPDCDLINNVRVPAVGGIEGVNGYRCSGGDCHLLIVDYTNRGVFESYITTIVNGYVYTGCLIRWNMCGVYPANMRGEQCTSADAAGLPITPFLFTPTELQRGVIDHALRFTLPNELIRAGYYIHPASHAGGPAGPSTAPLYGSRWRLKANFDDSNFGASAKVVIAALKKYGMILADGSNQGSNIPLTGTSDRFSPVKWNQVNFDSHSLFGIHASDFEIVQGIGSPVVLTYDCVRNPAVTGSCNVGQPPYWS